METDVKEKRNIYINQPTTKNEIVETRNTDIDEKGITKNTKSNKGARIGGIIGGALGTVMLTSFGRYLVFRGQDELLMGTHNFIEDLFKRTDFGRGAADVLTRALSITTNLIMANPAVTPIVGGLIFATVGGLMGHFIGKAKLKHKSLHTVSKEKGYSM